MFNPILSLYGAVTSYTTSEKFNDYIDLLQNQKNSLWANFFPKTTVHFSQKNSFELISSLYAAEASYKKSGKFYALIFQKKN